MHHQIFIGKMSYSLTQYLMVHKQSKQFTQISQEERVEIYHYLREWRSLRVIAKLIFRSHTSISREISRNSIDYWRWNLIYKPLEAEKKKIKRRKKANEWHIKLKKNHVLRTKIQQILASHGHYWWLDEILGYLKREWWKTVSTSTTYRYIRKYTDRWRYLRYKQDWYTNKRRKRKKTTTIKWVPKIDKRPEEVNNRSRIWDREWDTIVSSWGLGWLFTGVDRYARYSILEKIPNHQANTLLTVMTKRLRNEQILTITTDNWVEFANLAKLWKRLKIKPFTANPYASYERWTNEKTNWFIRWFIPKWSDISQYSDEDIKKIEYMLNHKPRKILGYHTPYEVYHNTKLSYLT
jgi:IS30 family transposase